MLTDEQKKIFVMAQAAADYHDGELDEVESYEVLDLDKVTETRDSIADFTARWGKPTEINCGDFLVYGWDRVQTAPGKVRGDLRVMDFGDARAAHFSGEA